MTKGEPVTTERPRCELEEARQTRKQTATRIIMLFALSLCHVPARPALAWATARRSTFRTACR